MNDFLVNLHPAQGLHGIGLSLQSSNIDHYGLYKTNWKQHLRALSTASREDIAFDSVLQRP